MAQTAAQEEVDEKEKTLVEDAIEVASRFNLHGSAGVSIDQGALAPSSISWLSPVGGTTSHTFTVTQPLLLEGLFRSQTGILAGKMELKDAQGRIVLSLMASGNNPAVIKQTLQAGSYTLTISSPQFFNPANLPPNAIIGLDADLSATRTSAIEGTVQLGGTEMPVSLRVAEFEGNERNTDYHLDTEDGGVNTLDPTKPVWVVIHGREDGPDSGKFAELQKALIASGYQVVTLDWNTVSSSNMPPAVGMQGERGIEMVADWAYSALKGAGVSGSMIRIGGHSWGSFVGYEIAERFKAENGFGVDTFVAMDSAVDPTLGARYDASQVNFSAVSKTSTAFHSSHLGSSSRAGTAKYTVEIRSPDVLNPVEEHGLAVTAFANLLRLQKIDPTNAIASQFAFRSDRIASLPQREGADAWLWVETTQKTGANSSDQYRDAIAAKMTTTNPDDGTEDTYAFNHLRDLTATIGQ